jgi:hypothetical protein
MVAEVIARDTSINLFADAKITRLTLQVPSKSFRTHTFHHFLRTKASNFVAATQLDPD